MRWGEETKRQRFKTKFLLLPKCIDGEWRWFERARWEENYVENNIGYYFWKPIMWIGD